ncbi:MAG: GntR family transcriptional regulator [bacterium]|nr:GntR family transcriptional regulator [bacterium]
MPKKESNGSKELYDKVKEYMLRELIGTDNKITEEMLATRFQVSRTPIREVLKHLEHEGLIETRRNKGITFRSFSPEEVAEVYDVRSVLEGYAARLAAGEASDESIDELAGYMERYTAARADGDTQQAALIDSVFHEKLLELCGNTYLSDMAKNIRMVNKSLLLKDYYFSFHGDVNPYNHAMIVEALRNRDPQKAQRMVQKHINWSKKTILKILKD